MLINSLAAVALLCCLPNALAQFPPTPEGVTVKQVVDKPGVSISYKRTYICAENGKGFAGYVNIPSSYLLDAEDASDPYNVSMFFWYFEAQHAQHAPTAIYLSGGPGESSMFGATSDGGPCTINSDSNSTAPNQYSWTGAANMLYVDQPVSTGFSYDTLINSTFDTLWLNENPFATPVTPFEAYGGSVPKENSTFLYGTFPSQNTAHTANNSLAAAKTLWHFTQIFFTEFPEYKTNDKSISYWGNSYGGYWVTVSAAYAVSQNAKIRNGTINGTVLDIGAAGFTNGFVDSLYQLQWYPDMAYNNTYGLQVIPEDAYTESLANYTNPGGCRDQLVACRELGDLYDPDQTFSNGSVNLQCGLAEYYCLVNVAGAYDVYSNRSDFDIAHLKPDPFPTTFSAGFFNQAWVQKALGVPVNFTSVSYLVNNVFLYQTGEAARTPGMEYLEYLLDQGVKVTLAYGDRDYRCPWNGAEHLSLEANWTGADAFRAAGYTPLYTDRHHHWPNYNSSGWPAYNGSNWPSHNSSDWSTHHSSGVVRQYGNFTFVRVFEAGHDVAVYQPEAMYEIFSRTLKSRDIATGNVPIQGKNGVYTSQGPSSSFDIKDVLPDPPPFLCNTWNVAATCTTEQYAALVNGSAETKNFIVTNPAGGSPGPIEGF